MVFPLSSSSEQTSVMQIQRGLHVLRYVASRSPEAPEVFVRPSSRSEGLVRFLFSPGAATDRLEAPGRVAVLAAESLCEVELTVRPRSPGGSTDATLKLEPLEETAGASAHRLAAPVPSGPRPMSGPEARPRTGTAGEMTLVTTAHVARRGDITAQAGAWIAGPEAPAPIEGINVRLGSDAGLVLEYQIMVAGDGRWSDWVSSGTYAGTKGRALPLSGVRFRLTGPASAGYAIVGSALFLGSMAMELRGVALEFRAPTIQDPLVGLRFDIQPLQPVVPPVRPAAPAVSKSHIRVFRAGSPPQDG